MPELAKLSPTVPYYTAKGACSRIHQTSPHTFFHIFLITFRDLIAEICPANFRNVKTVLCFLLKIHPLENIIFFIHKQTPINYRFCNSSIILRDLAFTFSIIKFIVDSIPLLSG